MAAPALAPVLMTAAIGWIYYRRIRRTVMAPRDLPDIRFDELALEPLANGDAAPAATPGRARFNVDLRSGKERRLLPDRRQELRFEADRRSGQDRRPRRGWEPGKNL